MGSADTWLGWAGREVDLLRVTLKNYRGGGGNQAYAVRIRPAVAVLFYFYHVALPCTTTPYRHSYFFDTYLVKFNIDGLNENGNYTLSGRIGGSEGVIT